MYYCVIVFKCQPMGVLFETVILQRAQRVKDPLTMKQTSNGYATPIKSVLYQQVANQNNSLTNAFQH